MQARAASLRPGEGPGCGERPARGYFAFSLPWEGFARNASGPRDWVCSYKRRIFCPKFLRQTFHEFARCSLAKSARAAAYVRMLRAKGHGFHSAVRALAFKWIRIIYRCWKTRRAYDEARYLQQLRLRNSPLLAYLTPTS
jgi:hypothetical protein